jgi:hypothetical protein
MNFYSNFGCSIIIRTNFGNSPKIKVKREKFEKIHGSLIMSGKHSCLEKKAQ